MSKKYELAWPERISSDIAVDKFLHEGSVDIESPSIADLQTASTQPDFRGSGQPVKKPT